MSEKAAFAVLLVRAVLVHHCAGEHVVTSDDVMDVGADVNVSGGADDLVGDGAGSEDDVWGAGAADEDTDDVTSSDADAGVSAYDDVVSVPVGSSSCPSCVP